MKKGNIFTVPFRRKREGRTYYKQRLRMLVSNRPRLVVRKSLHGMTISLVEYAPKGDKVIFTVNSRSLQKAGWKADTGNMPSAYLLGFIAGKKSLEKGVKEVIFDIGMNNSIKGSRLYAALAGASDAGLKIPFNPEVLPDQARISGEHISKYAASLKSDKERYSRQFSLYLKKGINPEDIVNHFNEIKGKLNG